MFWSRAVGPCRRLRTGEISGSPYTLFENKMDLNTFCEPLSANVDTEAEGLGLNSLLSDLRRPAGGPIPRLFFPGVS